MPITILIRTGHDARGGKDPPALTFDGSRIVIGRGPNSEVRLPEVSVSHRHATVRAQGADYFLVDEASTNGTVVGGARLAPHVPRALRSGDMIRVGRVWLEVRFEQKPATMNLLTATRDIALALVAEAMAQIGDDVVPRIRVVEGPDLGATLPLGEVGRAYTLGRGEVADLPLGDPQASREHVVVVRRDNVVLVRDRGSKNPAELGGVPLASDCDTPWRGNVTLRIGASLLAIDEPVAAALAELEQADDERIAVDEEPLPPTSAAVPAVAAAAVEPNVLKPPVESPTPSDPPVSPEVRKSARRRWSGMDVAVVVAAIGVIALSAAGLYWLLH